MPRTIDVEDGTPNLHFIIPVGFTNEDQCSALMHQAFQCCTGHMLKPRWIMESQCLEMKPTKIDVFVCEKFKGSAFNYFRTFKCVSLLGPRCVVTCLAAGEPIPRGENTIFSVAMNGLTLTLTGFNDKEKKSLIEKIRFMGGTYVNKLLTSVTHLVVNSVLSTKCERAVELGLTCVTSDWVTAIWKATQERDVHALDDEFLVHKCKAFHNLTISITNFRGADKEKLKKTIIENGGIFNPNLEPDSTKVLIVGNTSGNKYKTAVLWKIPRLEQSWLYESVEKGHIVNHANYEFVERDCSTPNGDINTKYMPDISCMSMIPGNTMSSAKVPVNETIRFDDTMASSIGTNRTTILSRALPSHLEVVQNLDLKEAERAGGFLDGCNIYLSGFPLAAMEKLKRLLKWGQATKFNEIVDSVTHVIVGDVILNDVKAFKACATRPHLVKVDWLVESMRHRSPAPEEQFLCFDSWPVTTEPPSPSLKKGLQMLQARSDKPPIPNLNISAFKVESKKEIARLQESLIPQYLNKDETFQDLGGGNLFRTQDCEQQNRDRPSQAESTFVSQDTTILPFFDDLTFLIVGFEDDDMREHLQELVTIHGGTIVGNSFPGVPDYAVVPFDAAEVHHATEEIVSYLWLEDCHEKGELVPLDYFHQPITVPENVKPLSGCVIGITSYIGRERDFIALLTRALGAISQDVLSKRDSAEKNAKASTHLICLEPGSLKYNAAIKWKLPAVTHDWVLACLKAGKKVGLKPYLVGDSTAPAEELEDSPNPVEHESTLLPIREPLKSNSTLKSSKTKEECTPLVTREPSNKVTCVEQETTPLTTRLHSGLASAGRTTANPVCGSSIPLPESTLQPSASAMLAATGVTHMSSPAVIPQVSPAEDGTNLINKEMKAPILTTGNPDTPVNTSPHYGFSQETPLNISRIRAGARNNSNSSLRRAALTPKVDLLLASNVDQTTPTTPKPPGYIETPETPYGIGSNPSPETRKNWKRWINKFPDLRTDDPQPMKKRRDSTPLSELYRRCWAKFGAGHSQTDDENTQAKTQTGDETNCSAAETPVPSARKRLSIHDSPEFTRPLGPINSQASGTTGIITQLANLNELLASPQVEQPMSKKRTSSALESDDCGRAEDSREKQAKISRERSIKEVGWTYDATQDETPVTHKFMLSTFEEAEREKYTEMITRLGGTVVNEVTFDVTATHLVSSKLTRSEKLLASIASGKWVLHKDYLDISGTHGYFVKEEPYEWGNSATHSPDSSKILSSDLARACHNWRKTLAESGKVGAFHGVRAILATESNKTGPYTRLILAGGGTLSNASPPFTETDDATHCFIETQKIKYKVDLRALVEKGVWCVPPIYLSNCLMDNSPPDYAACQIPEVKQLYLEKLKKQ